MTPPPLRWGLVAPGGIARKFARDLRVVSDGRLVAVASRRLERARAFADEFGAERAYDTVEALAADPAVDIVYVASPHNAHFEATDLLLRAGKPVLCEKPLTVNAAQTRALIERARTEKVFLMEAMWMRCTPLYRQVKEWLNGGRIGIPRLVTSRFCARLSADPQGRWYNPELAGGGLLDLGVYNLAASQLVFGARPKTIQATANLAATGVDELLAATLTYAGGGVSQLVCGFTAFSENFLEIGGEKGSIRVGPWFHGGTEASIRVGRSDEVETIREPFRSEGFEYEIEEAQRCLRAGLLESPLIPLDHTLATMETMDAIRAQIGLRYPGE